MYVCLQSLESESESDGDEVGDVHVDPSTSSYFVHSSEQQAVEKIESRSAISAVSLKKKKPKKDVVKINSKVLEKVESESENREDEEMDDAPSTGSDETVCDVEADEMMNHTIPAPVHVAVPFMISVIKLHHFTVII
ncbi:uncharacterized protein LOC144617776 isoform X2 [Crassostrea virginica]